MMSINIENLAAPEDLAAEDIHRFIGIYMEVYHSYVRVSKTVTNSINTHSDELVNRIALTFEQPLEQWLSVAEQFLPEWWDAKLLGYSDD